MKTLILLAVLAAVSPTGMYAVRGSDLRCERTNYESPEAVLAEAARSGLIACDSASVGAGVFRIRCAGRGDLYFAYVEAACDAAASALRAVRGQLPKREGI